MRVLLLLSALLLPAAAASASTATTKIIRFLDAKGRTLTGRYVGNGMAAVLNDQLQEQGREERVWRLLAPVERPPVILGIGLNYWGHINATHLPPPKTPSVFGKNIFSYNHPLAPVVVPPQSTMPDYEGELGIVFGKDCKDVSEDDALDCLLGYTVCHDVSARCFQSEHNGTCPGNGGQFTFSKGFDTHCPLGPALVPTKELGDGSNLRIHTYVNGELRQNQTTAQLIYGVKKIISFVTIGTTLPKGTVICTGTPDGVGDTADPPYYLQDGDEVNITIAGIGTLSNPIQRKSVATQEEEAVEDELGPVSADLLDAMMEVRAQKK